MQGRQRRSLAEAAPVASACEQGQACGLGPAHLLAQLGHCSRRAAHVLPAAQLLVELVGKVLHEGCRAGPGGSVHKQPGRISMGIPVLAAAPGSPACCHAGARQAVVSQQA